MIVLTNAAAQRRTEVILLGIVYALVGVADPPSSITSASHRQGESGLGYLDTAVCASCDGRAEYFSRHPAIQHRITKASGSDAVASTHPGQSCCSALQLAHAETVHVRKGGGIEPNKFCEYATHLCRSSALSEII